jgi:hypothetical protein
VHDGQQALACFDIEYPSLSSKRLGHCPISPQHPLNSSQTEHLARKPPRVEMQAWRQEPSSVSSPQRRRATPNGPECVRPPHPKRPYPCATRHPLQAAGRHRGTISDRPQGREGPKRQNGPSGQKACHNSGHRRTPGARHPSAPLTARAVKPKLLPAWGEQTRKLSGPCPRLGPAHSSPATRRQGALARPWAGLTAAPDLGP